MRKKDAMFITFTILLLAPISFAQDSDDQIWLPPSWVYGNGYTPYDYMPYSYYNDYYGNMPYYSNSLIGWGSPYAYYSQYLGGSLNQPYSYGYQYNPYYLMYMIP